MIRPINIKVIDLKRWMKVDGGRELYKIIILIFFEIY